MKRREQEGDGVEGGERKTLGFWSRHLKAKTLKGAMVAYPAEARRFFGAVPALRMNEWELAMIIDAHRVIKMSDAQLQRRFGRVRRAAATKIQREPAASPEELEALRVWPKEVVQTMREQARARLREVRNMTL